MKKLRLKVTIDRPKGYVDEFGNVYPINYGYVPGIIGGDGEEQDVYVISESINEAIKTFEGILIAVIHREDDNEDKWIVTSEHESLSSDEIEEKTKFLEQYFESSIKIL